MNCSRTCPTEAHVGTQMSEAVGWDVSQSLTCLVERPYDFGLCWCMNGSNNFLLYPVPACWCCVMFCHRPVRTGVFLLLRTHLLCATSKNRQLWKSPQHDSLEVVVLKQLMLFVIWYVMIIALFPLKKKFSSHCRTNPKLLFFCSMSIHYTITFCPVSGLPSMYHWLHVSERLVIWICFCSTRSPGSEALSGSVCQQSWCHFVCISVCRLIPGAFISCRSTALSPMPSQVETCDWQQTGWGSVLEAVLKLTSIMRK